MLSTWECPLPAGASGEEMVVRLDQAREYRLLILPALFDEANKMRRFTIEVMRRLDQSGIDCFLPDFPGMNESSRPLGEVTLEGWKAASLAAAKHFEATHVLGMRAGNRLVPAGLPGWQYAPQDGAKLLRSLLRARTISSREAGREETMAQLQTMGRDQGIELAGWQLGADMFAQLENAAVAANGLQANIEQALLGGSGLWLRAEPDEDPEQADALAAIIAVALDGGDGS